MSRVSKRAKLKLNDDQFQYLKQIARSRTAPFREVQRAKVLLEYANGANISEISEALKVTRATVYKCIDKALSAGVEAGLKDKYHRPKEPVITEEAKAWVVNLACAKPKDYGYAAELWTLSALAKHTRKHAGKDGHECLKKAVKATIHRILKSQPLQPHKIKYYLERRDEEFEKKMRDVLMVYKEVNMINDDPEKSKDKKMITVSADEKPGVQAIKNIAPDLPPKPGKHSRLARDYEYKRLGTLSVLAAVDLHNGHVFAQIHDRHRSREFILLLKELDAHYPEDCQIRIVLDNHSSHLSKETMRYLVTKPNRFIYVYTPKHGSWLNLIETVFSKMARTFLKHIRVDSKAELKERILKGIEEINENPVVHRWGKFDFVEP